MNFVYMCDKINGMKNPVITDITLFKDTFPVIFTKNRSWRRYIAIV